MNISKIIDTTSAAVANLVPALAGLTGNIAIASAGAIVAPIIQSGISDMLYEVTGNLQRKRVIASANLTCSTIIDELGNGKQLRTDDFFNFKNNPILDEPESTASKLFEGSLLKAKEEYDSKKIPYISFLTANIFFAPNIDESKAFVLLEILSKLSYRQLCALRIFFQRNILPVGRWESRLKGTSALQNYYDIAYEFLSLKDSLLIEQNMPNGGMSMGISDYRISSLGRELAITANLISIPNNDLSQLESKVDYITSSLA